MARFLDVVHSSLRKIASESAYANLTISGNIERAKLAVHDRGLVTEIVLGVLRHQTRIDRVLDAYADRGTKSLSPGVKVALRVAVYRLLFMQGSIPALVISEAIDAIKKLSGPGVGGFCNQLLRTIAEKGEPAPPAADGKGAWNVWQTLEFHYSLPFWIAKELRKVLPEEELLDAGKASLAPPPLWIRARIDLATLTANLREKSPDAELLVSAYCETAFFAKQIGAPGAHEGFWRGDFTVQDLAAQLVSYLGAPPPASTILDACAGVGGKTAHLADLTAGLSKIDAVDTSQRKIDLLNDAMTRLQIKNVTAICQDAASFAAARPAHYDYVFLDAPCTGLGVLRRHPEAKWRLTADAISEMAALQHSLLADVSKAVKPGGVLVYSVCSFAEAESEMQIEQFLRENQDFVLDLPPLSTLDWQPFLTDRGFIRTWPHRQDADAFFAARLRRRG